MGLKPGPVLCQNSDPGVVCMCVRAVNQPLWPRVWLDLQPALITHPGKAVIEKQLVYLGESLQLKKGAAAFVVRLCDCLRIASSVTLSLWSYSRERKKRWENLKKEHKRENEIDGTKRKIEMRNQRRAWEKNSPFSVISVAAGLFSLSTPLSPSSWGLCVCIYVCVRARGRPHTHTHWSMWSLGLFRCRFVMHH